ncbi:MAG: ATP-binding protein [Porticoccaceae bacterium]|nr:ATP-binding protein [Porticoccaceae bacterium]
MIKRNISKELHLLLQEYPIVTVLGPRQAGKTTLVQQELPDYAYVSLEDPDERMLAGEDPRAFLRRYPGNTIFDEVQRVPMLLSYLQGIVDKEQKNGRFVLTGSHQLELRAAVAQSLAGRTGLLHLLPLSIEELTQAGKAFGGFEDYVIHGFLPRVHSQNQRPFRAYANYYQTYIERDVRQLIELKDVSLFEKFIKLLAGRVGQLMDYQALSNAVGVTTKTIKQWLSVLEASYVVVKLPPYFENFGKRVVKSPKYFFADVGLLAYLLGIETADQVLRDPLLGGIFENLVVIDVLKQRYNSGYDANLYFFRDSNGNEIDLLCKTSSGLVGIEIKAAATWHGKFAKQLVRFATNNHPLYKSLVVYNGTELQLSNGVEAISYDNVVPALQT